MRKQFLLFSTALLLTSLFSTPLKAQWTEAKLQTLYTNFLDGKGYENNIDGDGDVADEDSSEASELGMRKFVELVEVAETLMARVAELCDAAHFCYRNCRLRFGGGVSAIETMRATPPLELTSVNSRCWMVPTIASRFSSPSLFFPSIRDGRSYQESTPLMLWCPNQMPTSFVGAAISSLRNRASAGVQGISS